MNRNRMPAKSTSFLVVCIGATLLQTALIAADTSSAERLFRVARRLAASDVREARAAYEQVLELDPAGPWADDALVEIVLLEGIPQEPEQFGMIDIAQRDRWLRWLDQVRGPLADGDRAREARRLRASLRLAPLSGRDVRRARFDLLELVEEKSDDAEAARARVWLGWLAMIEGRLSDAEAAWTRVVVDAEDGEASRRAALGLQYLKAFEGQPLASLEWFKRGQGFAGGDKESAQMAFRTWNRLRGTPLGYRGSSSERLLEGLRGDVKLAFDRHGSLWVARTRDRIIERTGGDREKEVWELSGVVALSVDPFGRGYAATDRQIVRLVPGGHISLASLDEYVSPRALAADVHGDLWVLDRRGTHLGRLGDAGLIETVWEDRGARLSGLATTIDGPVAVDGKTGALLHFDRNGSLRETVDSPGRASILVTDSAGTTYMLDTRSHLVVIRSRDGKARETIDLVTIGSLRPEGLAVATDGSLIVYDAEGGVVRRYR